MWLLRSWGANRFSAKNEHRQAWAKMNITTMSRPWDSKSSRIRQESWLKWKEKTWKLIHLTNSQACWLRKESSMNSWINDLWLEKLAIRRLLKCRKLPLLKRMGQTVFTPGFSQIRPILPGDGTTCIWCDRCRDWERVKKSIIRCLWRKTTLYLVLKVRLWNKAPYSNKC